MFFVGLDVGGLTQINSSLRRIGYNRKALAAIHDRDYLDQSGRSIADKTARFFGESRPERVVMVTVPRIFGYAFNPVTFYLGYDREHRLIAALAEVNNTFHERHVYVLRQPEIDAEGLTRFRSAKAFHVSPFNDRQGNYLFRVKESGDRLEIHVDIEREDQVVFRSGLIGTASEPLTDRTLFRALIRAPLQNLLTLPRIHWQAAKLYFGKNMRYFPKPGPCDVMTIKIAPPTALEKLGINVFAGLLKRLETGTLTLIMPDGVATRYGRTDRGPEATLHIKDYTFFRRILVDGDIGLGEAFMYGQWDTPDLTGFIAFLIANRDALQNGELKTARLKWLFHRIAHLFRSNTKGRSRKNIGAHYDLSNDFFALFLDPTMMYSAAYFNSPDESLEQAQRNKMKLLIEKAGIEPHHHVLEIGSGWGAFAIEIARTTGCRVTSITISAEQLKLARERVKAAGLEERVSIDFCDYRDLKGSYDRVVSIEMLEAVGHEHFDDFFRTIDRVLKPEGRAALQTITIPNDRYDAYRKSVDWIQKHIFPGGHLPSIEALKQSMSRCSKLALKQAEDIGVHYAPTLRHWRDNLAAHQEALQSMGYDDVFYRTWQYYFSYCEAAFSTRTLGNHHLVIAR
jgi:cyclopropane-fatty-acyl-phospholipid synthase